MTSDPRLLEQLRKELREWYAKYDSETMSVQEFSAWIDGMVRQHTAYAVERSAQFLGKKAEKILKDKVP